MEFRLNDTPHQRMFKKSEIIPVRTSLILYQTTVQRHKQSAFHLMQLLLNTTRDSSDSTVNLNPTMKPT
jgi:hypothetical protein